MPRKSRLLPLATLFLLLGCSQHPKATSEESLKLIQRFYTACNTEDQDRLNNCRQELQRLQAASQLSPAESQSFQQILDAAQANDWDTAEAIAFKMAQAQIR